MSDLSAVLAVSAVSAVAAPVAIAARLARWEIRGAAASVAAADVVSGAATAEALRAGDAAGAGGVTMIAPAMALVMAIREPKTPAGGPAGTTTGIAGNSGLTFTDASNPPH